MSGSVGDNTARASGVIAAAGGGKVLQVVTATTTTATTVTGNSYATSTLTAAITPTSSSNKIAVITGLNVKAYGDGTNSQTRYALVALFRGDTSGTNLMEQWTGGTHHSSDNIHWPNFYDNVDFAYLDSPSSGSEVTYTVGISGNSSADIQAQPDSKKSSIILMEIDA